MLFLQTKNAKGKKILYKNYFVSFTNFPFVLLKNWLQNKNFFSYNLRKLGGSYLTECRKTGHKS